MSGFLHLQVRDIFECRGFKFKSLLEGSTALSVDANSAVLEKYRHYVTHSILYSFKTFI